MKVQRYEKEETDETRIRYAGLYASVSVPYYKYAVKALLTAP